MLAFIVRPRGIQNINLQGYCQLQTTKGNINVEIHCDVVPRMAENFLGLCAKEYYDGTKFHRSIRNFMLQVSEKPS